MGASTAAILKKDPAFGAIGAITAEMVAESLTEDAAICKQRIVDQVKAEGRVLSPDDLKVAYMAEVQKNAEWGKLAGAITTLAAGKDVSIAIATASNAVENNYLNQQARQAFMQACDNDPADRLINEKDEEIDDQVDEKAEADPGLVDEELDQKQAVLKSRFKSIDEIFEFNNSIFLQHPDNIIPESSRLMAKTVMTHPEETLFLLSLMSGPVGRLTSAGLLFYDINENGLQILHLMGLTGTAASRVRAINTFGPSTGKTLGWLDNKLAEPAVMGKIRGKGEAFATKLRDWVNETSGPLNRQLQPAHAMSGPRQSRNMEALDLQSAKPKSHNKSTSTSSSSSLSSTSSSSTSMSSSKAVPQVERANQKPKGHGYHRAPENLEAFPGAIRVKEKHLYRVGVA